MPTDASDWTATAERIDAVWPGLLADPDRAARYRSALSSVDGAAVRGVVDALAASGRPDPPAPAFLRTVALARAQQAATAPPPPAAPLPAPWSPAPAAPVAVATPGAGAVLAAVTALLAAAGTLLSWVGLHVSTFGGGKDIAGRDFSDGRYAAGAAVAAALCAWLALWLSGRRAPVAWVAGALTGTVAGGGFAAWMAARTWSDVNDKADEVRALLGSTTDSMVDQARSQFPQLAMLPQNIGRQVAEMLEIGPGWGLYLTLGAGIATALAGGLALRRVLRGT